MSAPLKNAAVTASHNLIHPVCLTLTSGPASSRHATAQHSGGCRKWRRFEIDAGPGLFGDHQRPVAVFHAHTPTDRWAADESGATDSSAPSRDRRGSAERSSRTSSKTDTRCLPFGAAGRSCSPPPPSVHHPRTRAHRPHGPRSGRRLPFAGRAPRSPNMSVSNLSHCCYSF